MIVGSAIAPHGSLILPDSLEPFSKAFEIQSSMKKLANKVKELKPDIIFLSTPHGLALETNFSFYKNQIASGSAEWHTDYKNYSLTLNLDVTHTNELLPLLKEKNHKVEGITTHAQSEPIYIRWGEVVPCWFLKDIPANYIIMCQPSRRYDHSLDMISELQDLGKDVGRYLELLKERVFVLISGDMAHTYQADGPYGIHPTAEPFDKAVEKWVRTMDEKYLVEEAGSMIYTALSCGFTGFVFVDALMKSLQKPIQSSVYCNTHETYYGMLVATFDV